MNHQAFHLMVFCCPDFCGREYFKSKNGIKSWIEHFQPTSEVI